MLNLGPWYDFVKEEIIDRDTGLLSKNEREMEYIVINLMCCLLSNVSEEILSHYCKSWNIVNEYAGLINAKNGFLVSILILAQTKKRYISSVRLRECKEFTNEKLDIKRFDFIKSSTTPETKEYFLNIVKTELLDVNNINPHRVLKKFMEFDTIIKSSLKNGEKNFLVPKSVKEFGA